MRKGILIPFIFVIFLTVWVYARDETSHKSARSAPPQQMSLAGAQHNNPDIPVPQQRTAVLPERWATPSVKDATRNPFLPLTEKKDPPPIEKPKVEVEPVVVKPPTPPLTYQLVGKLIDGSGMPGLYLQQGDTLIEAKPGLALDDGFSIDTVENNSVSLVYPASGYRTVLTLPEIPH